MGFWSRLTRREPARQAAPVTAPASAPAQPAASQPVVVSVEGEPQRRLGLALLQRQPAGIQTPKQLLQSLDSVLQRPGLDERWLPRAAALIPQLMRLLRQPEISQNELVQQVSRDHALSAEVLRLAASPAYGSRGTVRGLDDALGRLGHLGLQRAMTRVVLRPLLNPEMSQGLAPALELLRKHQEWQADALADRAMLQGLDAFDGYLAGLLHSAGWQALLRIADAAHAWPPAEVSVELADALAARAHRLFGRAAAAWSLSPAFVAFAESAESGTPQDGGLSLAWRGIQIEAPMLKGRA